MYVNRNLVICVKNVTEFPPGTYLALYENIHSC